MKEIAKSIRRSALLSSALVCASMLSACHDASLAPSNGDPEATAQAGHRTCAAPVITAPGDGSALKTKVVTVTWTGSADELRLGTSAGASDIYDAALDESETSRTVSNLPLNGAPLYLELRVRCGSTEHVATSSFVAGIRHGLAVVVDFADSRLEDWQEAPTSLPRGFHTMQEVRDVLDDMEEHWNWLSRGKEKAVWNLVRVQLSENLMPNAFPAIREFRSAVMDAVRAQTSFDPTDYDADADGIVEGVWMVVSSRDAQGGDPGYDYLSGGAFQAVTVKSFVDSQGSYAVRFRRYGAFNHEFAHNVGLPDLYGRYSTVNGLTLMGQGVENLPANDLGAWERVKLGWLVPRLVEHTERGLVLPPANDQLAALKIPTRRSSEYFVIEYRKTPESGFGSVGPRYDGLAVYHVLGTSTQNQNPPLLKLEAAGPPLVPEAFVQPEDLFYPENPNMHLPYQVTSYLTGGVVFAITGVARTEGGMSVDVQVRGGGGVQQNLVQNPSFEDGTTTPDAWSVTDDAQFAWVTETAHTRRHSVSIASDVPADAEWRQQITGLTVGRSYLLCGWVKGDNIQRFETMNAGGTVSVSGSFDQASAGYGTFDWTQACLSFEASETSMGVACRLGGFSSTASGTMWCDDFSLIAENPAF